MNNFILYVVLLIHLQSDSNVTRNNDLLINDDTDSILVLTYSNLNYFYNNFTKFSNIKSVDADYLRNVNYDSLFYYLSKLPKLQRLNLSRNDIKDLSPNIGLIKNLEELTLIGNPINNFPTEFLKLTELRYLNLTSCKISNLNSILISLQPLNNLKEIYLDDLNLSNFPNELTNLTQLHTISIAHNQINSIPDDICNLANLNYLIISNNDFKSFPHSIRCLDLQILQISEIQDNNIDSINNAYSNIKKIFWF